MLPIIELSWLGWGIFTLAWVQIVILLVTVYFHRACSHRALDGSPVFHRVCRFLSWFMIAMVPREFAAVHRKHHATCDTQEDPHSPLHYGWKTVLFKGLQLYRNEVRKAGTLEKYGNGLPKDPWEGFYQRFPNGGIFTQLIVLTVLFGWFGAASWAILMAWIPFWAAGVINGLGHHWGYRRFATEDRSTNLTPFAFWVGGEELHNNHHAYPASPKFSHAWYEVDLGWGVIVVLEKLGLVKVRRVDQTTEAEDPVSRAFIRLVKDRHIWQKRLHECFSEDAQDALRAKGLKSWHQIAKWTDRASHGKSRPRLRLEQVLNHPKLAAFHEIEQELTHLWRQRLPHLKSREAMDAWIKKVQRLEAPAVSRWCQQLSA